MHPKNSRTTSIINKINSNLRLGYESSVAGVESADGNSILCRTENDSRYFQRGADVDLGNIRLQNLLNGALPGSVMNKSYIDGEVAYLQGQIDNLSGSSGFLSQENADTLYYKKSDTVLNINADIVLSATRRILVS